MTPQQHRREADAAKASMLGEIQQLKSRLSPARLTGNAVDTVREKTSAAVDTALGKPVLTGSITAGLALLIARKPIMRLFCRSRNRDRTTGQNEGTNP